MKKIISILVISIIGVMIFISGCGKSVAEGNKSYTLNLSYSEITMEIGETKKLVATYGKDFKVNFSTSDEEIAMVDEEGIISAIAEGVAYVEVSVDGKSKTCRVNVIKNEYAVNIDCSDITLFVGTKKEITATVYKNGNIISATPEWIITPDSGNLKVNGNTAVFDGKAVGEYKITVKYKGSEKNITFTVITPEEA